MKKITMMGTVCIYYLVFLAGFCQAGQFAVSMESDQFAVGAQVDVSLIFLENGSGETANFPDEIICELISGKEKLAVSAKKIPWQEDSGQTEENLGVRQHYSFSLPGDLQGQVVMSFTGIIAPRVVLDVVTPKNDIITTKDKVYPTLDSMFTLYQPYQNNISPYQPVYFLVGTDMGKSKFQISFKYQFFDVDALFSKSHPWVTGLHFGYTQTSFWDLKSASAPFDDTSYKPEFFWLSKNYLKTEHGFLKGVFFQGGFQHESNGKAGDDSRSTNYMYVKPVVIFYDDDSKFGLQLLPKIWSYIENDETTNPDLPDYRGYFDLETKFGFAESLVAGTHFRLANEGTSFQFDISYPLNNIFGDAFDVYFFAEYTNVLAEDLLDYQQRTQVVRLGLAFIR